MKLKQLNKIEILKRKNMYGYFKMNISEKKLAKVMYALIITKSKLVNCNHLGLEQYTRKQNSNNGVDLVIDIKSEQIHIFEDLAEVKLKTSDEFQGRMCVNKS